MYWCNYILVFLILSCGSIDAMKRSRDDDSGYTENKKSDSKERRLAKATAAIPVNELELPKDQPIYLAHVVGKYGYIRKGFCCSMQGCRYAALTEQGVVKHARMHDKKINGQKKIYACNTCDFLIDHKSGFARHLLSHENVNDYFCSDCKARFKHLHSLTKHVKEKHQDEFDFEV